MTIQDLGSIGELVAAIATIATIAYLAVQVRQNTRALRSSTFHGISEQMAQNVVPILSNSEVAELVVKGFDGLSGLTPAENLRFRSVLVMSLRRMESIHIQSDFGAIDANLIQGFERSMLSLLQSAGGAEWWVTAKTAFTSEFSDHVDRWLVENDSAEFHPTIGVSMRFNAEGQASEDE